MQPGSERKDGSRVPYITCDMRSVLPNLDVGMIGQSTSVPSDIC